MKSMKTVLAVAILVAGISYVAHAYPPTFGTADQCCSPRPEDTRVYHMFVPGNEITTIIPEVEGTNGFVLTDVLHFRNITFFQDTGEGPIQIFEIIGINDDVVNLTTGVPLIPGSTITVVQSGGADCTFIGYVY